MGSRFSSPGTWFPSLPAPDKGAVRLVCLPYAGGGTPIFHPWRGQLPRWIQLVPLELPGRWGRIQEAPSSDLVALAEAAAEQIALLPLTPTALFGYSYGALLAHEIAHALRERHRISACHLFVGARRAPHRRDPGPPKHLLDDAGFRAVVERIYGGGFEPELLAHPDMSALLLRILRADIRAVETYAYRQRPPLTCPVLAFGGLADPTVPPRELDEWRHVTVGPFASSCYGGGHFFLRSSWRAILQEIERGLGEERSSWSAAGTRRGGRGA
jgi:surfactin synthase thioesterase subunit